MSLKYFEQLEKDESPRIHLRENTISSDKERHSEVSVRSNIIRNGSLRGHLGGSVG